jgi:hypothetical protein
METCSFSIEIINVYNPPMNPKPPSPMLVFETLQAHQQTSALRAGIELKLFTAIAGGGPCTHMRRLCERPPRSL